VVLTAGAGFALGFSAAPGNAGLPLPARIWLLGHALLGTALVAAGTSALNQVAERDVDGLMRRTRDRPLPAGRLRTGEAAVFAWLLGVVGTWELAQFVNATTAVLAAATLLSYVFIYTPMKRHTPLATLVGAVPGALPVVGGWTAAGAPLDGRAAVLFAVLFLWQIPHFLALSWLYREDYARAGLRMLSLDDPEGRSTFQQATLGAAALLPVSLAPTLLGLAGPVYFAGALALSLWFLAAAIGAARAPTTERSRRLFLVSLAYLPALLILMVADTR
jgi:protoheme IX farnesyltransferase